MTSIGVYHLPKHDKQEKMEVKRLYIVLKQSDFINPNIRKNKKNVTNCRQHRKEDKKKEWRSGMEARNNGGEIRSSSKLLWSCDVATKNGWILKPDEEV